MTDYINIIKVLSALVFVYYTLNNYFAMKYETTLYKIHVFYQALGLVTYLTLQFKLI